MKLNFTIGNDNGNASQKISFGEETFELPNIFVKTTRIPQAMSEISPVFVINNIFDHLFVTIKSPNLENNCPQSYYVGAYTERSGNIVQNMSIGLRGNKLDTQLPIITTLANTAAYAVHKVYQKEADVEKLCQNTIKVIVDMATALPNAEYSKENAMRFRNKFLGQHIVTVYLGSLEATVEINIGYVKVMPEGVPAVFYALAEANNEPFKGLDLKNKRILHVAIGDGTTDYPITDGVQPQPEFINSTHNGIGIAIEKMIDTFAEKAYLSKCTRQDVAKIVRNQNHRNHALAMELLEPHLEEEAQAIKKYIFRQLERINNEVDYIFVYGGGSILLKPYLLEALLSDSIIKSDKNKNGIDVVYMPEQSATTIEAKGLYIFTEQPFFKDLAKAFKEK